MSDDSEILLDVAVLGEQIDQFMKSDIGQFLMQHAAAEEEAGIEELKKADCQKPQDIWAAQCKVWRAESFRIWLQEAVGAGLKARLILEDREE
jgi:hypothetical protein